MLTGSVLRGSHRGPSAVVVVAPTPGCPGLEAALRVGMCLFRRVPLLDTDPMGSLPHRLPALARRPAAGRQSPGGRLVLHLQAQVGHPLPGARGPGEAAGQGPAPAPRMFHRGRVSGPRGLQSVWRAGSAGPPETGRGGRPPQTQIVNEKGCPAASGGGSGRGPRRVNRASSQLPSPCWDLPLGASEILPPSGWGTVRARPGCSRHPQSDGDHWCQGAGRLVPGHSTQVEGSLGSTWAESLNRQCHAAGECATVASAGV